MRAGYRSPSRGGTLIPDGWEAHHQPVAEQQMTARGRIIALGEPVFDRDTNTHTRPAEPVWPLDVDDAPIRVQQLVTTTDDDQADQQVTTHEYRVTITRDALPVQVGHVVEVTAADDPQLVGRRFTVTDVLHGSLIWQRDLICTDQVG